MKNCSTCKYWYNTSNNHNLAEFDQKECQNEKNFYESGQGGKTKEVANESLMYSYYECGTFYTGPNFGCVHHTERDDYQEE